MYVVIGGGGIIGSHIASLLSNAGHEITIIEESREILEKIHRYLDVATIEGNAAAPKMLRTAEVQRADLMLAVTSKDEINMIACFMAKEMGAGMTVARIRNPAYSSPFSAPARSPTLPHKIIRPRNLGIDMVINPEAEAAREIVNILSGLYSTPVESFAADLVQIREFKIEEGILVGKTAIQLSLPKPCVIAALVREGKVIIPPGDQSLKEGDSVYLIAEKQFIDEVGSFFSPPKRQVRKVVVVGGGRIGVLLAKSLSQRGIQVKLIEQNIEQAEEVAAELDNVTVLNGDGTDKDFLTEQGIASVDAFVATTESEEKNILSGLLAKTLGVPRNLALLNRPESAPLAEAIGVDVAAVPALITANKLARFVLGGGVVAAALLEQEQLEAIEFIVGPSAAIVGKPLGKVELPNEMVIGAVVRGEKVIIPRDDTTIEAGDHAIVVASPAVITAVEKLFKV